ncbi:hypothetical protein AJ88_00900 [Mesorhizobium amorphae CCBAU 01583]|nr:hypothetical protein AJ88_00900 [Mesorhizobium amorphae CCBAU 01583]
MIEAGFYPDVEIIGIVNDTRSEFGKTWSVASEALLFEVGTADTQLFSRLLRGEELMCHCPFVPRQVGESDCNERSNHQSRTEVTPENSS